MLRPGIRLLAPALLGIVASAWGCGGDEASSTSGGSSSTGGAAGSNSGGTSSGGTSSGGTSSGGTSSGGTSSGGTSSGGTSSGGAAGAGGGPDPNPVLLASGTSVEQLQVFGTRGFARIGDATNGAEEWSTDFTKAGTKLIVDSCPGACSGAPREVQALPNGTIFFAAKTSESAQMANAIYAGDGTAAGTAKLPNTGGMPAVVVGTKLVCRATNTSVAISDGTSAGTSSLKNLSPYFFGQETESMTLGARGLFTMLEDPGSGSYVRRIYGTDGTSDGTVLVGGGQFVDYLVRAGDVAFLANHFFAPGQFLGTTTISVTDGTVAGTKSLTGSFLSTPGVSSEVAVGAAMYFRAKSSSDTSSVWYKADASAITKLPSMSASSMVAFGDKATFVSGTKIMQTDGTTPVETHDTATDAGSSYPSNLTPSGTTLWFTLDAELWKLEGSPMTATKVATFANDCPSCSTTAVSSSRLSVAGARVFVLRQFTEKDATKRPSAIWFSDGTSSGTKLLQASGATELVITPTGVLWTNGTELWHEMP